MVESVGFEPLKSLQTGNGPAQFVSMWHREPCDGSVPSHHGPMLSVSPLFLGDLLLPSAQRIDGLRVSRLADEPHARFLSLPQHSYITRTMSSPVSRLRSLMVSVRNSTAKLRRSLRPAQPPRSEARDSRTQCQSEFPGARFAVTTSRGIEHDYVCIG